MQEFFLTKNEYDVNPDIQQLQNYENMEQDIGLGNLKLITS